MNKSMTTTRRALVLIALVAGVLFASGAAAQASYSDTAKVTATPMTVSTATVAAPGAGPGSITCRTSTATMALTWTASTSARVNGYRVTVYFSDGYSQTVQMTASDTSWSQVIALYNVTAYSVRYSVTTLTDYGWTKESASTGWFRC
jgi:archaellum component FlaG (FlaF/FlaG flagellin family)